MKIIKQVDVSQWGHRATCSNCDSELQIESSDVQYCYHEGYDQREPAWDEYYAICPVCSTKVHVPEKSVPKALQVKVKAKGTYGGSYFDR